MSTLTEKITEAVEKHAYDFGDCECSEYALTVPYPRHLAEVVAAVVAEWLREDASVITVDEYTTWHLDPEAVRRLAAEAVKGAGQ